MGVHLFSIKNDQTLAMSWVAWSTLLITGRTYGWLPTGTLCPAIPDWGGSYHSNDGQLVTAEDAAALAAALQTALDDLASYRAWHEALEASNPSAENEEGQPWYVAWAPESEEQAGKNAQLLSRILSAMMGLGPDRASRRNYLVRHAAFVERFIAFATEGPFEIY